MTARRVERRRGGVGRATTLGIALLLTACASAPSGSLPPSDPAEVDFAPELGVDLADFERTSSGLYMKDLTVGLGSTASGVDEVWIYYVGWLPDGTVFDATLEGDPFHFRLGANGVIRGWDEGIRGMKVGGRRRLVVRPGLAYGTRGRARVPPGATLVFEVQLIDAN